MTASFIAVHHHPTCFKWSSKHLSCNFNLTGGKCTANGRGTYWFIDSVPSRNELNGFNFKIVLPSEFTKHRHIAHALVAKVKVFTDYH